MILKNWYKILFGLMAGGASVSVKNTSGSDKAVALYSSNAQMTCHAVWNILYADAITDYGKSGILFGDGNTPPTVDDYKLSGNIITGCTSTLTNGTTVDTEGLTRSATITVTNNNSSEITISEVCLARAFYSKSSSSSLTYALVDRTLVEPPVTIPAGGVGQVNYTIRMDYPTA